MAAWAEGWVKETLALLSSLLIFSGANWSRKRLKWNASMATISVQRLCHSSLHGGGGRRQKGSKINCDNIGHINKTENELHSQGLLAIVRSRKRMSGKETAETDQEWTRSKMGKTLGGGGRRQRSLYRFRNTFITSRACQMFNNWQGVM